jgi:hypothetical protein
MGIRMIACGADGSFVNNGAIEMAKRLDSLRKSCAANN